MFIVDLRQSLTCRQRVSDCVILYTHFGDGNLLKLVLNFQKAGRRLPTVCYKSSRHEPANKRITGNELRRRINNFLPGIILVKLIPKLWR